MKPNKKRRKIIQRNKIGWGEITSFRSHRRSNVSLSDPYKQKHHQIEEVKANEL